MVTPVAKARRPHHQRAEGGCGYGRRTEPKGRGGAAFVVVAVMVTGRIGIESARRAGRKPAARKSSRQLQDGADAADGQCPSRRHYRRPAPRRQTEPGVPASSEAESSTRSTSFARTGKRAADPAHVGARASEVKTGLGRARKAEPVGLRPGGPPRAAFGKPQPAGAKPARWSRAVELPCRRRSPRRTSGIRNRPRAMSDCRPCSQRPCSSASAGSRSAGSGDTPTISNYCSPRTGPERMASSGTSRPSRNCGVSRGRPSARNRERVTPGRGLLHPVGLNDNQREPGQLGGLTSSLEEWPACRNTGWCGGRPSVSPTGAIGRLKSNGEAEPTLVYPVRSLLIHRGNWAVSRSTFVSGRRSESRAI